MNKFVKQLRVAQLKAMHQVMIHANDEEIYITWISGNVPDCPSDDDFEYVAEDDDCYNEACDLFAKLVKNKDYRA